MKCLWCEKEVSGSAVLCAGCEQIATGVPGLAGELLDVLPFGVIELNKEGIVIAFNEAEERLSGQSKGEVIGKNFFSEIAPCADVQEFHGRFDDFLRGGESSERFNFAYYIGPRVVQVQITFLRVNQQLALVLSKRIDGI